MTSHGRFAAMPLEEPVGTAAERVSSGTPYDRAPSNVASSMPHDIDSARVEDVQRIVAVRPNGIGDYVFLIPALDALRAAYPRAEIVLVGQRWHEELLHGRPGPVDRVIALADAGALRGPAGEHSHAAAEAVLHRLRGERVDIALQVYGGGRYSNPFVRAIGARVTAGLRTPDAAGLDRWLPYTLYQPEILRYLEVVSLVGARPVTLQPHLVVTDADIDDSLRAVPADASPLLVLHPGASDPRRRWPPESFARAADALVQRLGVQVAVTGTAAEADAAAAVVRAMRAPAVDLCGRLSMRGLVGLLARAALVMSNDTGPRHVADAVGTPTVAVYWCGNLVTAGPLWRRRHRALASWRTDCPVCGADCINEDCGHRESVVSDVSVDDVVEAALDLWAREIAPEAR